MNVLTIFTGGTIACSRAAGALAPDRGNSYLLLDAAKGQDVEFTTACPYMILSENLSFARLRQLFDCLTGYDLTAFDGVIIAHGTDTLPYTAAYLSLRLGLCETPVVLVSAAYPLSDSRTNGYRNFLGALDFIRAGAGKGVFVSYQNDGEPLKLHRGAKILPQPPLSDRVESLFGQYYAEVRDGAVLRNPEFSEDDYRCFSQAEGERAVLWLRAHPGMRYPSPEGCGAVLLEGYHSGTLPTDDPGLADFCERAAAFKIPVYLTGSQEGFEYESKQAFDRLNIRVLPPMSPVTAYVGIAVSGQ